MRSQYQTKKDLLWMVAGFAAAIFMGDYALSQIRVPVEYGSTNECLIKMDLYHKTEPVADIIFLGSSYCEYGINAADIDCYVESLTGDHITSLNLCTSAASMHTQYLMIRRIIESGRHPKTVYLESIPRGTVGNEYSWLRSGLRAMGDYRDIPTTFIVNTDFIQQGLLAAMFRSYPKWLDVQLATKRVITGAPFHRAFKTTYDHRGWAQRTEIFHNTATITHELCEQYKKSYFAENAYRKVNAQALRKTVALLRQNDIEVKLLEMPIHPQACDFLHAGKNAEYQSFVNPLVIELDLELVSSDSMLVNERDFFDLEHLNATKSDKLTRWLVQNVSGAARTRFASYLEPIPKPD